MTQKTACLAWFVVYALVASAVGLLVYRRFPVMNAALVAAVVGGLIAWMGIASFAGIRKKVADAIMIRRALGGEEPEDGAKIAAIGPIMPTGPQPLISPLTRVRAKAAVEGTETTITLGDGAVILKIDRYDKPIRLSLLGEEMGPREFEGELDLQITEKTPADITGRLTFFSGLDPTKAARARFRARVLGF